MAYLAFLKDNARWLAAGALLSFLSSFGQTFFLSVFAGEIRAAFDLSHGDWGLVYTAGTALSAVLMIWAGGLADLFRVRALGAAVILGLAAACVAMALNRSLVGLVLVILALRFFGQGMTAHVAIVAMARWFVATRGKALAVATIGFALGEAVLPIGSVALKRVMDWHQIFLGAAVLLVVAVPVLFLLLSQERTPAGDGEATSQTGMEGRHWTRAQALRHPLFWAMVPSLLFFPAFGTAFWFHQMHFAEIKGWAHLSLVAAFPLGTAAFLGSTVVYGWAIDRWGSGPLLPVYLLPLGVAFTLHAHAPTVAWSAAGIVLAGVAGGGQSTLPAACWAEFFGTRHIGSIKAAVAAVMVLGSALGPGISGVLIDWGVELEAQYQAYALLFLMAAAVVLPASRRARRALPALA